MATAHVLARESTDAVGDLRVVIHYPTPAGNNSAGFSWKEIGLRAGILGASRLSVGPGPGQITQVEYDAVLAGDVVEFEAVVQGEAPGQTLAQLPAAIDAAVTERINEHRTVLGRRLKWYGATRP